MKLWIWSDVHLEMQNPVFPDRAPPADVIICAGDLCHALRWAMRSLRSARSRAKVRSSSAPASRL
jgi:3',5'-cyclic AMP phosphodiesterase CpdA